MGKKIRVQRRGRGTSTFRASTHKRIAPVKYPRLEKMMEEVSIRGIVSNLLHEPGRGAPLALVQLENQEKYYSVAVEGLSIGQEVAVGSSAPVDIGNVVPLGKITSGASVCNIESRPGDGGKLVRSSGGFATVIAHTPEGTLVKFPSGKIVTKNDDCRATVGIVSGSGRPEKPFLKAGSKWFMMHAKGHKYHMTRGVAMVSASHPYGGGRHKRAGRQTSVSRNAPPGRKVGLIAPRQTGRSKRRRR